jgi:hypothetical protein
VARTLVGVAGTGFGSSRRTRMTVVVTVKAYPTVSERYGESVCVAGIRTDVTPHVQVRLFPVGHRDLPAVQRFAKWQTIELEAQRVSTDTRPESFLPILPTITLGRTIGTQNAWAERRALIAPFVLPGMCGPGGVRERSKSDGLSLAVIKPREVRGLEITPAAGWSDGQRGIVGQGRIELDDLVERSPESLEELPYKFRYRYLCRAAGCTGHRQSILDWEIGEAYRSWRDRYGEDEVLERVRQRWYGELVSPQKDPYFLVGNAHQHPTAFMVLGVVWPPATPPQGLLF